MASANSNRNWWITALVVGSTVTLLYFGNGLNPWWPLMWFAPLPILWFSLRTSWWHAGLVATASWLAGSLNLLGYFRTQGMPFLDWLESFGGIALMVAAGVLLFRRLALRGALWSSAVALAAIWVSLDWLRYQTTPHATSADLAYTQLQFLPVLQLAAITGPWGMSFLLLVVPATAAIYLHWHRREPRQATRLAMVTGGILLAVLAYGFARLSVSTQSATVKVGLITSDAAGNSEVAAVGADAERSLNAYAVQARLLIAQSAQVIVMPEKIAAVRDQDEALYDSIFQPIADQAGVTIVAGELHISPAPSGLVKYNRATVYSPGMMPASYDKVQDFSVGDRPIS